jgi:hypothetical protein
LFSMWMTQRGIQSDVNNIRVFATVLTAIAIR